MGFGWTQIHIGKSTKQNPFQEQSNEHIFVWIGHKVPRMEIKRSEWEKNIEVLATKGTRIQSVWFVSFIHRSFDLHASTRAICPIFKCTFGHCGTDIDIDTGTHRVPGHIRIYTQSLNCVNAFCLSCDYYYYYCALFWLCVACFSLSSLNSMLCMLWFCHFILFFVDLRTHNHLPVVVVVVILFCFIFSSLSRAGFLIYNSAW